MNRRGATRNITEPKPLCASCIADFASRDALTRLSGMRKFPCRWNTKIAPMNHHVMSSHNSPYNRFAYLKCTALEFHTDLFFGRRNGGESKSSSPTLFGHG